jgi:polyferredoxin
MGKRKSLSKRVRFSIFDRDGFTCQYCGKAPPEVMLQVDHIVPVAKGGTDDPGNLTTSCMACNSGKSDIQLNGGIAENGTTRRAQEALEAQEACKTFDAALDARTKLRQQVTDLLCEALAVVSVRSASVTQVINTLSEFDNESVIDWVYISCRYPRKESDAMRYFHGIIKNQRAKTTIGEST